MSKKSTDIPLLYHLNALRELEAKIQDERDRRYAEVNIEKEKALKIKETADLAALQLAREIQTYKDEKANELREQISSERNLYASKADVINSSEKLEAMMKPVLEWMNSQQGRGAGFSDGWKIIIGLVGVIATLMGLYLLIHR